MEHQKESGPSITGKRADEILCHRRLLEDLALLVMAPLEKECRIQVSRAIMDESNALSDSYSAWVDYILDRLE
ncbi:MAG: hypothetical protein JRM91_04895 [Nitrososphaerota archaeon]|nr:hypothetical protein [Nitrososphaerota archaeon]